jgi:hypothetical protein
MQRPRRPRARDVGAALDDRLVPGSSVDRWGLVAERGVSPAVVVVRLPVADHHPRHLRIDNWHAGHIHNHHAGAMAEIFQPENQ